MINIITEIPGKNYLLINSLEMFCRNINKIIMLIRTVASPFKETLYQMKL